MPTTIIATANPTFAGHNPDPLNNESTPIWQNPENVLSPNPYDFAFNQYSNNTYPDESEGNGPEQNYSRQLIIKNCGFNLPENAVIEGLKASVLLSGLGTREGGYAFSHGFISDGILSIVTPSSFALHTEAPATRTFGSYTETGIDPGNSYITPTWTPAQINSPNFSFVYSAYIPQYPDYPYLTDGSGEPYTGWPYPYTKIYSVTIEVAYHLDENWYVASGGGRSTGGHNIQLDYGRVPLSYYPWYGQGSIKASGHGASDFKEFTSGGIRGSGKTTFTYNEISSGGLTLTGTSHNYKSWLEIGLNGTAIGATSDSHVVYNGNLPENTFDFICSGNKAVPSNNSLLTARASVYVDTTENKAYWNVVHNITGLTAIQFRGPATKTTIGPLLFAISPTAGPFISSISITEQQKTDLLDGKYYLLFVKNTERIRGQISSGSISFGGKANDTWSGDLDSAGVLINGNALELTRHDYTETVNTLSGGSGSIGIGSIITGGSTLGGTANSGKCYVPTISSSGLTLNGSHLKTTYFGPIPTGGLAIGGKAIQAINQYVSSGISIGATATYLQLFRPNISGGALIVGYHKANQFYASRNLVGGVILNSRSRIERVRQSVSQKINIGHALKTPNLLSITTKSSNLINYASISQPQLDENRLKLKESSGWCDFGDTCNEPYLPKIVKNRQGKYIPPKKPVSQP